MQHPVTWELQIQFSGTHCPDKDVIASWLTARGIDTFVEGVVELEQTDLSQPAPSYEASGGLSAPFCIYDHDAEKLQTLQSELAKSFPSLNFTTKSFATESWTEGWKESFKPISAGRFTILPPWESNPNTNAIWIDPGFAFGTGQHATTRLCLELLEKIPPKGELLDVGTGSGVLSIAAHKLGFSRVAGCDIDPYSIKAATENSTRNECALEFFKGSAGDNKETWDVVLANILAVVIKDIFDDLYSRIKPNGSIILSGFLTSDIEDIVQAGQSRGLTLKDQRQEGDWVALLMTRAG
ncbi:MAG: 50S ribosomal protein L11 methyltransferase [Oligoflexales bacterium]